MPKLRFPGKMVNLSKEQYLVIKNTGNNLVLACPGSGKTRLLTCKSVYLHQRDRGSSRRIILITFTKKASQEMTHRVRSYLPESYHEIMIGTFHHLAYQVMKHCGALPKNVRIIDQDEQSIGWDTVAGNYKEKMQYLCEKKMYQRDLQLDSTEELFLSRYQHWKTENNYIDFSDIILLFIKFLDSDESKLFHQAYSHILVDECQDLNQLQYQILKKMFPWCTSLTLVGDIAQSIYGFRYAKPDIVYICEKEFKLKRFYLTTNYRSASEIISLSNKIYPREMIGLNSPNNHIIEFYLCKNEFNFLVGKIEQELRDGTPFRNMLIMARSHWYLHLAATVLRNYNIPIRLKYIPLSERKTGKKIISLLRILNSSETHLDKTHWNHWVELETIENQDFKFILEKALDEIESPEDVLIKNKLSEAETPAEALKLFLKAEPKPDTNGVMLSTIHQSKGMEFPVCFLIGAADQFIPHAKSDDIEEEKRLLYVAVTRAIKNIYISCATKIGKYDCQPSRFFENIIPIKEIS